MNVNMPNQQQNNQKQDQNQNRNQQNSRNRNNSSEDVLSEGQVVQVKITDIAENKRISLSIRALLEQPDEDAE